MAFKRSAVRSRLPPPTAISMGYGINAVTHFLYDLIDDELVKSENHAIRWLSKNTDIQVSVDSEE